MFLLKLFLMAGWIAAAAVPKNSSLFGTLSAYSSTRIAFLIFSIFAFIVSIAILIINMLNINNLSRLHRIPMEIIVIPYFLLNLHKKINSSKYSVFSLLERISSFFLLFSPCQLQQLQEKANWNRKVISFMLLWIKEHSQQQL